MERPHLSPFFNAMLALFMVTVAAGTIVQAQSAQQRSQPSSVQSNTEKGLTVSNRPQSPGDAQNVTVQGHLLRLKQEKFQPSMLERLRVPEGFAIRVFAQGFEKPRMLAVDDRGTVYVTDQKAGKVIALTANGQGQAGKRTVLEGLEQPHGLAVHNGNLYVTTITEVYRAPIQQDGSLGSHVKVLQNLPDGGQHPNRTIAFSPQGEMFVSIGSSCNNCSETNKEHATILRASGDGSGRSIFAKGLRNTIGFGWHPATGQLWGMDHGSDWRGNDMPPEELNLIEEGKDYGWPYCYADREPDLANNGSPDGMTKEQYCKNTVAPVLSYQAHTAPIAMVFYRHNAFPAEYRNNAFVAMRGSWNRDPAVGYKVVRITFDEQGKPQGFHDFATGWLMKDQNAEFGRLAGLAVTRQGSLLVSDDRNGVIYEIARQAPSR